MSLLILLVERKPEKQACGPEKRLELILIDEREPNNLWRCNEAARAGICFPCMTQEGGDPEVDGTPWCGKGGLL